MEKLLNGIIEFRRKSLAEYRSKFANLANRPAADALFIACCDSRVVPNTFASTNPGDLFVLRNIGNFVSPYEEKNMDESGIAAIEFSMHYLHVKDIIICGHSECAAIKAIVDNRESVVLPHLREWLCYGEPAYDKYQKGFRVNSGLSIHNEVSQINVLQQLVHLKTYPIIQSALENNKVRLHGWWFELDTANVYAYQETTNTFMMLNEHTVGSMY